jgi:protein involved in sex pheromone biosynthesis
MFLFSCCTQIDSNEGYELRAKHSKQQQYSVISNIDHQSIDYQTQVLKVKKSQYRELVMKYRNSREMWEDQEFPHNGKSLGDI